MQHEGEQTQRLRLAEELLGAELSLAPGRTPGATASAMVGDGRAEELGRAVGQTAAPADAQPPQFVGGYLRARA